MATDEKKQREAARKIYTENLRKLESDEKIAKKWLADIQAEREDLTLEKPLTSLERAAAASAKMSEAEYRALKKEIGLA